MGIVKLENQVKGIRNALRRQRRKLGVTLSLAMVMAVSLCSTVFAASTTTDFTAIKSALTSSITVGEVGALIASILGVTVSFAILWWGARKLVRSIVAAFKSGKIKF